MNQQTVTLTITCSDQTGLISAITGCIAESGGNILNLAQHTATDIDMFFCRILRWEPISRTPLHQPL